MRPHPLIVVTTAPWATERTPMVERLLAQLEPECRAFGIALVVHQGEDRSSHIPNYTAALRKAIDLARFQGDATHITLLPDDAILVPHFVEVLCRLIEQRPNDQLCLLSNHAGARAAYDDGATGYYTTGGSILFGGTMRVAEWEDYLDWRERALAAPIPMDNGVNVWSILRGVECWKPLPSLCEHDTTLDSMLGNQWQEEDPAARILRHSQVWYPVADLRMHDWREPKPIAAGAGTGNNAGNKASPHLGRTFKGQHWDIVRACKPEAWDLEAMYTAERMGVPVSEDPHVMLVVPMFGEPAAILSKTDPGRRAVVKDLLDNGVDVTELRTPGDSLVQRMRQRVMHQFLKSPCTHLLWWDADIELLTPHVVREMVGHGKAIVAGAYPFKDNSGKVVCNIRREDFEAGTMKVQGGCVQVLDAGTGFMLVERRVHVELAKAHPELLHLSLNYDDRDEPLFALYDTSIDKREYLSEDYQLCRLWQRHGGEVHVYLPAKFKHWGIYGYEGSFEQQWDMQPKAAE